MLDVARDNPTDGTRMLAARAVDVRCRATEASAVIDRVIASGASRPAS